MVVIASFYWTLIMSQCIVLSCFPALTHLILLALQGGRSCDYPHFVDVQTEVWRRSMVALS